MAFSFFGELKRFLDDHAGREEARQLRGELAGALASSDLERILGGYDRALELAGQWLWEGGVEEQALGGYQALFREREALLETQPGDHRHRFVVVIPVADRPRHLRACLHSLLELCRAYRYGGLEEGRFRAVQVVVADDSRDALAIRAHRELAEEFSRAGLEVLHFDQQAQLEMLASLPPGLLRELTAVLGIADPERFWHKGPSRMRNITYMLLQRMANEDPRRLFLFIDSDQEFRVLQCLEEGNREVMAVNYFHHLDRIFSGGEVSLLTGKVVGDPPVAPAVMAGNFLEDVIAFLLELGRSTAGAECSFHGGRAGVASDAAYHDMADLFGFDGMSEPHRYHCTLQPPHDQLAVFTRFAERLNGFFDGEHPTRTTCYRPGPVARSLQPARTVYTGNYVTDAAGLRHFIPFAALGLRMAGPVMGRILRAELGGRFVSANLPLLHRRTVSGLGESEFRPGVNREQQSVDLSAEFERQFFGDVMLFSVEALAEQGFPRQAVAEADVRALVEETARRLRNRYDEKQQQIRQRLEVLGSLLGDADAWWCGEPAAARPLAQFRRFLANMEANFGVASRCHALLDGEAHRRERLESIVSAILAYPEVRRSWERALELSC